MRAQAGHVPNTMQFRRCRFRQVGCSAFSEWLPSRITRSLREKRSGYSGHSFKVQERYRRHSFQIDTSLSGWPSKVLYAFTGKRLCERLQALTYAFRSKKSAEK